MPSPRLHAKKGALPASLSTRDFLSARSSRPTLQVLADTGRLLQRLRARHGHQRRRNWSRDCRPGTDTSASGCRTQRQLRTWSTFAPQDDARQPSRCSHPCECPAPSLRARAAHASGISIPYPYPMTLTRQQACDPPDAIWHLLMKAAEIALDSLSQALDHSMWIARLPLGVGPCLLASR